MSKTDPYFQFHLCALTFQDSVWARCDSIIAYSICEAGFALWGQLPDEAKQEKMYLLELMEVVPEDVDWKCEEHLAVMYGIYTLKVTAYSVKSMLEKHAQLKKHVAAYEKRNLSDVTVRVKTSLLFEARDEKRMNYRELSVFCAILSAIGSKSSPVLITFKAIQRRAFGYKSVAALETDASNRLSAPPPKLSMLTPKQIRSTVEKLHELGWFARCTYSKRLTYYSTRMSDKELRDKVFALKTRRDVFKSQKTHKDNDLTVKIKAERVRIKNAAKMGQVVGMPEVI